MNIFRRGRTHFKKIQFSRDFSPWFEYLHAFTNESLPCFSKHGNASVWEGPCNAEFHPKVAVLLKQGSRASEGGGPHSREINCEISNLNGVLRAIAGGAYVVIQPYFGDLSKRHFNRPLFPLYCGVSNLWSYLYHVSQSQGGLSLVS